MDKEKFLKEYLKGYLYSITLDILREKIALEIAKNTPYTFEETKNNITKVLGNYEYRKILNEAYEKIEERLITLLKNIN